MWQNNLQVQHTKTCTSSRGWFICNGKKVFASKSSSSTFPLFLYTIAVKIQNFGQIEALLGIAMILHFVVVVFHCGNSRPYHSLFSTGILPWVAWKRFLLLGNCSIYPYGAKIGAVGNSWTQPNCCLNIGHYGNVMKYLTTLGFW